MFASRVTEEMLLQHIDLACNFFEKGELPWYGIQIASIVTKYYEENNKFKELSEKHDYINRMYSLISTYNLSISANAILSILPNLLTPTKSIDICLPISLIK